jgi:hypothetical protein
MCIFLKKENVSTIFTKSSVSLSTISFNFESKRSTQTYFFGFQKDSKENDSMHASIGEQPTRDQAHARTHTNKTHSYVFISAT